MSKASAVFYMYESAPFQEHAEKFLNLRNQKEAIEETRRIRVQDEADLIVKRVRSKWLEVGKRMQDIARSKGRDVPREVDVFTMMREGETLNLFDRATLNWLFGTRELLFLHPHLDSSDRLRQIEGAEVRLDECLRELSRGMEE